MDGCGLDGYEVICFTKTLGIDTKIGVGDGYEKQQVLIGYFVSIAFVSINKKESVKGKSA